MHKIRKQNSDLLFLQSTDYYNPNRFQFYKNIKKNIQSYPLHTEQVSIDPTNEGFEIPEQETILLALTPQNRFPVPKVKEVLAELHKIVFPAEEDDCPLPENTVDETEKFAPNSRVSVPVVVAVLLTNLEPVMRVIQFPRLITPLSPVLKAN